MFFTQPAGSGCKGSCHAGGKGHHSKHAQELNKLLHQHYCTHGKNSANNAGKNSANANAGKSSTSSSNAVIADDDDTTDDDYDEYDDDDDDDDDDGSSVATGSDETTTDSCTTADSSKSCACCYCEVGSAWHPISCHSCDIL